MYPIRFDVNSITIRFFHKFSEIEDVDQFLNLYKRIFEREYSKDVYLWYEKLNGKNIWAIAQEIATGNFVAIYGLMPISLFLNSREIKGFLCHNTGVISNYQGKGLFQYLGDVTLNKILQKSELAIGFPNRFAARGHKVIGWHEIGKMIFYIKKEFGKYKYFEFQNIYEVDNFPEDINKFSLGYAHNAAFLLKKNSHFLNWRISKPYQEYRCFIYKINKIINGYMFFKVHFDHQNNIKKGHIVDIMAENDYIFSVLLRKAEEISELMHLDLLNLWIFEKSHFADMLSEEGFNKDSSGYDYPFIVYSQDTAIMNNVKQLDGEKVILSLGDNDVF
jgi:hypothetical protein